MKSYLSPFIFVAGVVVGYLIVVMTSTEPVQQAADEQLRTEIAEELRIEITEEVRAEIAEQLRAEIVEEVRAEIVEVAQIEEPVFEDTKKARNERLNKLFRRYVRRSGGIPTAETIKEFNALVKEYGLTTFDDFLIVQTTPLKFVKDPVSGDDVPIFGPLGSDVINGWLAAMEVLEGEPLDEQPMYCLASDALSEHIDFALIGIKDPTLSFELLPPGLRANAEWAYQRLNPTNKFDGGFDHPLFYATIREATKKLFREDYPEIKLSMAALVAPEEQGGFGIRSCLLCHDRDHSGVYKRLLGQGRQFEAKAAELRNGGPESVGSAPAEVVEETIKEAEAKAEMFLLAAQRVLEAFPDKIDSKAVEESLVMLSRENLARLKPGYDEFSETLEKLGCLDCHGTDGNPPSKKNPAKYGGFVLDPSLYYKSRNITALLPVVNMDDLSESKLLKKAEGKVQHRGKDDLKLDEADIEELRHALRKWIYSFTTDET